MGKIRGLGRQRGIVSNMGLMGAVGKVIGRSINALDDLSKREASSVIEAWSPEEHLVPPAPPEETF
jgi:hypothetical protein